MNVEENRLNTFSQWPANVAVEPSRIAKAGFYYTGVGLEAQCFLCGSKISEWNYGDQVMARHRQIAPDCPFVLNPPATCNVPLIPGDSSMLVLTTSSPQTSSSSNVQNDFPTFHNPGNQSQNIPYRTYSQRLRSFSSWPASSIVTPERLAKSGFYFLQRSDMVACAFCRGVILEWVPGDDPDNEHRRHFPNCNFYLYQDSEDDLLAEGSELGDIKLIHGTADLEQLGIHMYSAPRQPKYATYESRLQTFQEWPEDLKQTPESLAAAGFYYVGTEDRVRCFHCDGGLCHWEATDDAWVEHARWFPKCGFINLIQGQDFIKHCIANRPPLDPSIFRGTTEDGNENEIGNSEVTLPTTSIAPQNTRVTDLFLESLVSTESPMIGVLQLISTDSATEDENENEIEEPAATLPTTSAAPQTTEVTDGLLDRLLSSEPAMVALAAGLQVERVKRTIKKRMERTGNPYTNAEELIEDALHEQLMEDDERYDSQMLDSPASELINLLNQVVNSRLLNNSTSIPSQSSRSTQEGIDIELDEHQSIDVKAEVVKENDKSKEMNDSETAEEKKISEKTKANEGLSSTALLKEENRKLREARLCKICMDKEIAILFLPCGHLTTCVQCAPSLTHCPICRKDIRATIRTFLS